MKRFMTILVLLLLAVTTTTALAQEESARIRVVHASPDAPPVDVRGGGETIFSDVAYNSVTDYTPVASGSLDLKVVPAGSAEDVLAETPVELEAGQAYTVVVAGKQALLEPFLLEDDASPPGASQVRVRFIHASPNTPAVDVVLESGSLLFNNVPFKNSGNYISLDAGTYSLAVQIAGTGVDAATAPDVDLAGGTVYTLFATGLAGGLPELQVLVAGDAGEAASVSVLPAATATAISALPAATATTDSALPAATATEAAAQMVQATPIPATPTVAAPATEEPEDDDIEPGVMPVTGGDDHSIPQLILLGLGLLLLISVLAVGFHSSRQPVDTR